MNPTPTQPDDLWETLPSQEDEFYDARQPAPEERALHFARAATPAEDPGRSDVALDGTTDDIEVHFADEEPETLVAPSHGDDADQDDVEAVLESQHYAFGPEDDST